MEIAIIADDAKKELMTQFCIAYCGILSKHNLCATATTAKYISEYLEPLGSFSLTASMVSNYVKKDLIGNPVKKQYDREQIARLFFVAVAKNVLSIEDIRLLFEMQHETYEPKRAYDYFCSEFENVLQFVFGLKENLDTVGTDSNDTKTMLRNTIIAVAYKVCVGRLENFNHINAL